MKRIRLVCRWLAASLACVALAVPAAALGASPGGRVTIGANRNYWTRFKAAVPGARDVRVYYDVENVFPATWPTGATGAWVTLSLRPNPADLLSGKLDARLKALFASAPAHSEVTFWHENEPGDPLGYAPSVNNARTNVAMLRYGENLVQGTKVKFGQIICAPAIRMQQWIAPGLDWYGIDLFANPNFENPNGTLNKANLWTRLDNNEAVFRAKTGRRWPAVRFDESNARRDWHRKNWFTYLVQWLHGHGGGRLITRWTPVPTNLAGPWPPSRPVIARLRALAGG
ncbi:MAG TPA: hypothetical protein VF843_16885 [Streptosporangiaceae bacterium]